MLNHVLHNREGRKVAVIVNDMSEVNIDAALVKGGGAALNRSEEKLIEMSNGCICCTLREDLLLEVAGLAREGRFDQLVIESTGISEPLPVAETFTFADEQGRSLNDLARLDTMVTVVDAFNFIRDFGSADSLIDRQQSRDDEDDRCVVDLLVDQIEFADVIILNKTDLVTREQLNLVTGIIKGLNPQAKLLEGQFGKVPLTEVLNTKRFSMEQAQEAPGGLKNCAVSIPLRRRNTGSAVLCTGLGDRFIRKGSWQPCAQNGPEYFEAKDSFGWQRAWNGREITPKQARLVAPKLPVLVGGHGSSRLAR